MNETQSPTKHYLWLGHQCGSCRLTPQSCEKRSDSCLESCHAVIKALCCAKTQKKNSSHGQSRKAQPHESVEATKCERNATPTRATRRASSTDTVFKEFSERCPPRHRTHNGRPMTVTLQDRIVQISPPAYSPCAVKIAQPKNSSFALHLSMATLNQENWPVENSTGKVSVNGDEFVVSS